VADPQQRPAPGGEGEAPAEAFSERWASVAPAVFAWASLHVRQPLRAGLDPEDVLQEVACRAYARRDAFDPSLGDFRGWVFGIARNVLYQSLQRLGRSAGAGEPLDTDRWGSLPDTETSITRRVARDEELAAFLQALAQLPEDERRLVVHRGLEGLSHAESAKLLGVSVEAATKRWLRLRERLQSWRGAEALLAS
jgi:RNA polymerase sigma factor (sigma-70 family)